MKISATELAELISDAANKATKTEVEFGPAVWQTPGTDSAIMNGEKYLIRTPTVYHLGRVVRVTSTEVVLDTCSWIVDTGRLSECLKNGTYNECEPMGDGVIVPRCNISDMSPWAHALPTVAK